MGVKVVMIGQEGWWDKFMGKGRKGRIGLEGGKDRRRGGSWERTGHCFGGRIV